MPRTVVSVEGLGHGKQPIPLAVTVGPLLVTGNVSGVDKDSGTQPAELRDEIANAFANVGHVLDAAGFGLDDLAKVEVLLADPAARDTLNEVWTDLFPNADDRPARHTSVANLPNSLRVQVSITAMRP